MDLLTVVTSAAVGTIVATAMSMFSQSLERRSRKRELLMQKAIELAIERARFTFDVAKASGVKASLSDPAITTETYFQWLLHLWDNGKLPEMAKMRAERSREAARSRQAG